MFPLQKALPIVLQDFNWDFAEILVSNNNGFSFTPLCGKYTHNGNSSQDSAKPLYDGFQRKWVKESIDLSAYLGQNIKLRFKMVADGGVEYDGFYFDDITVKIINPTGVGIDQNMQLENNMQLYPNPNAGSFVVSFMNPVPATYVITITNVLGEVVFVQNNLKMVNEINLQSLAKGTYFVKVQTSDKTYIRKVFIGS